jgi:hypothetical protein
VQFSEQEMKMINMVLFQSFYLTSFRLDFSLTIVLN